MSAAGSALGCIGLGVMGEPICRNLVQKSGRAVLVSRITLFDGRPVAKFDGLPGSTSRVL